MRLRHFLLATAVAVSTIGLLTSPAGAVTDNTAPTVTVTTPKAGAKYAQNTELVAKYSCKDSGGSGLSMCTGTYGNGAKLPTQTLGVKTFKVWASDGAGNLTKKEVTYEIVDKTAPTISLDTPAQGDVFVKNDVVLADFSCKDPALGSGIDTCVGTVADGDPINTATIGTKTFKVTATDLAGNKTTKTVTYKVVNS